jgi:hypothetical protein
MIVMSLLIVTIGFAVEASLHHKVSLGRKMSGCNIMVAPYIADSSDERCFLRIANPNSSPRLSCVLDRASRMVGHARTRKDGDRLYAYNSISSAYERMAHQLLKSQGCRRRTGLC